MENYKTVNPKSGCGHLIKGGGYLQGVCPQSFDRMGKILVFWILGVVT